MSFNQLFVFSLFYFSLVSLNCSSQTSNVSAQERLAQSRTAINTTSNDTSLTGKSAAANADGKSTFAAPTTAVVPPTIKQGADNTSNQNGAADVISKIVGVANLGLGAFHASEFAASCPTKCDAWELAQAVLHFGMAAQSFIQAGNHQGTKAQAGDTSFATTSANAFGDPGSEINHLDPNTDFSSDRDLNGIVNTAKLNQVKKSLLGPGISGIKLDPNKGIITVNDKTYKLDDFKDKASLQKAGFSSQDIASAFDASSKAETAALKKLGNKVVGIGAATPTNGFLEGSGGSSFGNGSSSQSLPETNYNNKTNAFRNPANSSSKIAGLTKNFNGERIGVSAENIFDMMTRRYKTKEKQNSFYDPSELIPLGQ